MNVLVKVKSEHDLTPEKLAEALQQFSATLSNRCEEAYIFGSCATGKFSANSDIDLIIVKETSEPFSKRALEFLDLFDIYPALDILVYKPEEFDRFMRDSKVGFWKHVRREKKRIL